jgi:pilus assembly protein CpaE
MTAFTQPETGSSWRPQRREATVRLYLAGAQGDSGELIGARVAGFPLELNLVPVTDWIDPDDLGGAVACVIQVDPSTPASVKRFQKLAAVAQKPLIAAAYDPPLALVRSLLRSGASDVLPLPLDPAELETSLRQIQDQQVAPASAHAGGTAAISAPGKVVTVIKSDGGAGATSLLGHLAARFAAQEVAAGREACLLDLDLQFGDSAFQLGMSPGLSVANLLDAGSRLDRALIRATSEKHSSGLDVIAAPKELMPVEGLSSDELVQIVDLAAREFGTLFVDLPTNWTNWSLSVAARSDLLLLVTELTIPSLHRARRQMELIRSQGLGNLEVRVVVNRFEKGQLRTIGSSDVRDALGYDIGFTIANEPLMKAASERGVTVEEIKRRTQVGKDLDSLNAAVAVALGVER